MAGLGSLATTAIITKGLTGGHAPLDPCKTGIITSAFSLYCTYTPPEPTPPKTGGGGPYPGHAWNKFNPGQIQNFYKPVEQPYIIPRDREAEYFRRRKIVTMKIKLGDISIEKEYAVPEKRANMVISVLGLANKTVDNIKVAVSAVKRITTNAVVKIKNLRLKKQ